MCARRGEIGVANAVAAARPVRHHESGGGRLDAADGDHVRVVGRSMEPSRAGAFVACGGDHNDACTPGSLDRRRQRVGEVWALGITVDGEIEHSNVERVCVFDDPVDAGHEALEPHASVATGNLDGHDASTRSDPVHDAGEVGSVTVVVDEGRTPIELLGAEVDRRQERSLGSKRPDRRDASVDDGDIDTRTGDAGGPQSIGTDLMADLRQRTE